MLFYYILIHSILFHPILCYSTVCRFRWMQMHVRGLLLDIIHVTWGVSSNQNGEDPGVSPGHDSLLLWHSSALRSFYWTSPYNSCDLKRFVQSEMPRPECFTWSCFLPFVVDGLRRFVQSERRRPRCFTGSCFFPFVKYFSVAQLLVVKVTLLMWLEAFRPIRNAETSEIHLIVLLAFCC